MDGDRFFWLNQAFGPKTRESIAATTPGSSIKRNKDTAVVPNAVFVAAWPGQAREFFAWWGGRMFHLQG